ncbi:uncharacterized protein LOC115449206 [Manduca sexta]|uniref:uncharacterized protein LOC115449206 n=1 Tax=Manduca sexta TaxID=7130 RepID=UPI001182BEAD|nr:uncharacterized protein LOC115449206 [Manduca sexta]XP_037300784.1 uncharacterized protein LOC115449206 [Manduca sexta]
MKLLVLLTLAALAMGAPKDGVGKQQVFEMEYSDVSIDATSDNRNLLVNALIRQFFAFIRNIINNGWPLFGIPVLDPLNLKEFHLQVPAELLNLDLDLKNVLVKGLGQFIVHRSNLNLRQLSFDIDISFPVIHAEAEQYDLVGDMFTAIPLYGKGGAVFNADGFRFHAKLFLKQSEDGQSVLIDRVENAGFLFPQLKSDISGAIGGGDIDYIVNAMIEEVIFDYVNRFRGAISNTVASAIPPLLNPFLNQLDTWRFIAVLLPRN